MSGWQVIESNGAHHVVPVNDRQQHQLNRACWCGPRDDAGVIVHNSKDRREADED